MFIRHIIFRHMLCGFLFNEHLFILFLSSALGASAAFPERPISLYSISELYKANKHLYKWHEDYVKKKAD